MPTVTLLAKAYNNFQLKQFDKNSISAFEGLKVETKICGVTSRGWVQIAVSGEDENVALHYLSDRIGLCPADLENVKKFSTIKGYLTAPSKSKNELYIDIGLFSPRIVDAEIPLQRLQAQLADGRKVSLGKLVELYGFHENLPVTIKITCVDEGRGRIEAELAERQQRLYSDWTRSMLDRLLIIGASHDQIKSVLERAGFSRDVVNIEPLGIFEHAVVCKLGTDAAGLIPRIGKNLSEAAFSIYKPRRILEFLGE